MTALNLYRRSPFRATLALLLIVISGLVAAQRRAPHKLRATALLELSTDAHGTKTARVTPIVILDEGNFHDASIYKSEPEPMAVQTGVVYEAEKAGLPAGFVTISSAAKDRIWMALGKWQPPSDQPKPKPSATPVQSASDERPHLHRGGSESTPTPAASPAASPASQPSGSSDDRPVLRRPQRDSPQASPTPSPTPSSPTTGAATPAVTPEETSSKGDPDRPMLRRGKPTPTPPPTETSPSAKAAAPGSTAAASSKTGKPGSAASTQVMVAVSDAEPYDHRSFQFMWKPGEEAPIAARLRHQAAQRLAQEMSPRVDAVVVERELKNVVIRSFDVDLTNDAVMVLTAELPGGSAAVASRPMSRSRAAAKTISSPETPPPPASNVTRYITLISRVDLDGNPQVLAASLTDSSRLDVAPRLELVDAVDVDGDGIAELLFRAYDFDNQSFVIYGVRHGAVTKIFQGASQALLK